MKGLATTGTWKQRNTGRRGGVLLAALVSVGVAIIGAAFSCSRGGPTLTAEGPAAANSEPNAALGTAPADAQDSTGAAGASASSDIPTNTLTAADVPPIPPAFELLYVVGFDTPGTVHGFLPVEDTLYWIQQATIWRAPKDGSANPVAFGHYDSTNDGSALFSDGTYIYWHDGDFIKRKRMDSQALSPSNPIDNFNFATDLTFYEDTESLEYGGRYSNAVLDMDDTDLFIAHASCMPIHKLNLETLAIETFEFDRPEYGGGGADLKVDTSHIYCGNLHGLFRLGKNGSSPEILYEDFNNVGRLAMAWDRVYLLDMPTGSAPPSLFSVEKDGGSVHAFGKAPELSGANNYNIPLFFDEPRNKLYWSGPWLTSLVC